MFIGRQISQDEIDCQSDDNDTETLTSLVIDTPLFVGRTREEVIQKIAEYAVEDIKSCISPEEDSLVIDQTVVSDEVSPLREPGCIRIEYTFNDAGEETSGEGVYYFSVQEVSLPQ